jgi:hypothetical protein
MRRLSTLLVLALLVAVFAVPASAGPSDNPFVGSWVADFDGSHARMQFGGNGHFHVRAASSPFCEESAPLTLLGTFEPDDWNPAELDVPTVKVSADGYCHYGPDGGRQWVNQWEYWIWYLEDTDTLMSTICWYRPGSDPSVCD